MKQKFRFTAFLTAGTLFVTSVTSGSPSSLFKPAEQKASDFEGISSGKIAIPKGLGKVLAHEEAGGEAPLVLLIQDAHAIPAAQRNIQLLIDYLRSRYGVSLVAAEGASSELDPLIFRSFPEKEHLREVLGDYFDRGELAGVTAAAVLNGEAGVYRGIEDWTLYEEGLRLYLAAEDRAEEVSKGLVLRRDRLEKRKEEIYSRELLEIDRVLNRFYENQANLIEVLKLLSKVHRPSSESEVGLLLREMEASKVDDETIRTEVKKLAKKIKSFLKSKAPSPEGRRRQALLNSEFQEFQTSRRSPEAFAHSLEKIAREEGVSVRTSVRLSGLVEKEKRLGDITGTSLFRELEEYAREVKGPLLRTDEERELDREDRLLRLLTHLNRLEMSREEWGECKRLPEGAYRGLRPMLEAHLSFYRNAEEREKAFLSNLKRLLARARSTVLVAGGFHTEGIAEEFKAEGISYVLIVPEIGAVPKNNPYRSQMRGEISWKEYLKVERGRINLHDAFVRAARDRLVQGSEPAARRRLLKSWRDQLLRDLAGQNRLTEARRYTRFLDEAAADPARARLETLRQKWLTNVDRFFEGLRLLRSRNELNPANVLKLLQPSMIPAAVSGSAVLSPASEIHVDRVRVIRRPERPRRYRPARRERPGKSRSEVRHDFHTYFTLKKRTVSGPKLLDQLEIKSDHSSWKFEVGSFTRTVRPIDTGDVKPALQSAILHYVENLHRLLEYKGTDFLSAHISYRPDGIEMMFPPKRVWYFIRFSKPGEIEVRSDRNESIVSIDTTKSNDRTLTLEEFTAGNLAILPAVFHPETREAALQAFARPTFSFAMDELRRIIGFVPEIRIAAFDVKAGTVRWQIAPDPKIQAADLSAFRKMLQDHGYRIVQVGKTLFRFELGMRSTTVDLGEPVDKVNRSLEHLYRSEARAERRLEELLRRLQDGLNAGNITFVRSHLIQIGEMGREYRNSPSLRELLEKSLNDGKVAGVTYNPIRYLLEEYLLKHYGDDSTAKALVSKGRARFLGDGRIGENPDEGEDYYHGTRLGLVATAISNRGGFFGDPTGYRKTTITPFKESASRWADTTLAEGERDGLFHGDDEFEPSLSVKEIMSLMTKKVREEMGERAAKPIVLELRYPLETLPRAPEIRIPVFDLNWLSRESKEELTLRLGLQRPFDWMDEDWKEAIRQRAASFRSEMREDLPLGLILVGLESTLEYPSLQSLVEQSIRRENRGELSDEEKRSLWKTRARALTKTVRERLGYRRELDNETYRLLSSWMVLARRDAEALGDEDLRRNIEGHSSNLGKLLRDKRRSEARTGDKALLEAELRGRLVKTGLKYPVREIYIFKPAPAAATYIAHLDIGDAPLSDAERHLGSLGETLRSVDGFSSYTFGIGVLQGENARILPFILTPRKSTSRSETRMTKEALIRQLGTLELSEFVRHFESFDKGRIRHLLQLLKEIGEANLINPERALEILVILERANIRDYFPNDEEVLAPLRGAEDALREIVRSDPEIKMMKEMIGSEGLVKAIGVTDRVISEGIIETFNRVAAGEKADALEGLIFASLEPLGISEVEEAFTRGLTNSVDRFIWDNTDSEVLPISIEIASHLGWLATTGAFLGQPFAYERINFYERALESGSVPQRRIAASFFSNFYQAGITDSPELLGKLKRMVEDRGEIPEIRADAFEALSKNAFAVEADFFSPYFENREKETFEIPFSPEKRPSFQALLKALKIGDDLAQKKAGRSGYILELMDVFPDYETSGESLLQLTVVAVVFQQFLGQTIDLVDAPIILANLARALRSEVREEQTFFTGTYTATMDDRFRIFVPNGLRRGAGVEKSLAVVVTPEGVIRVYPKTVWERLLREGTPGDPEAVEAYKRRIIPNTYFLTLDSIGRLTLINEIRERGSVAQRFNFTGNAKPTRVKLVGIGPFFEIQPQGKEEEKSLSRSEARLPVLGKEDALRALTRAKRQADLEEAAAGAVLEEAIRQIGTFNLSDLPQKDDWGDFFRYISYDLAKQREPRPFGEGIERQAGFALNYFVEAVQFRPPSDRRLVLTAFLKAILAGSLLGFLAKLVYFLLPRRNLSGEKPPERRNRKEALPAETHGLASAPGRASAERSEVRIVRVDSLDLEKDLAEGFGELGKLVREAARKAEHRNAAGFLLRRTSPANEADRRNWEALGFRPAPVLIPQVIGLLTDRDKGTFLEWFTDSGLRKEEIGKLSSQLRTEEEEYQRKVRALRTAIGPLVELSLKTLRAAYSKASDQGLFVKPALAPSAKEYQEDLAHVIFRIEQFKDYSMQSIPFALILESEDEERALRRAWEEVGREAGQILEWIRLLSHGRVSVRSPEEALVPQKKADQKAAEVQVTGRRIARRSEMRKDKEEIVREVLRSRLTRRARGRNLSLIKKRRGAVEKSGRESKQIAVNLESIFQEGLGVPIPVHEITSVELFDPHPPDSVRSEARNDPAAPREDPAQHWKEFLDYLLRSLAPDLPVSNGRKAKPTLSLKDNNRGIALFIPNPSKGAGEGVRFSMSNGRHPDAARYSISASVISKVGERLDTQRIKSNLTRESLHDFILQVLTEEQVTPRWREHLGDWAKEVNEFRARFREEWASYEEAGRQESLLVLRNAKGEKMELLLFNSGDFRISLPPRDGITREWVLSEEGLAERRLPEDLQTSFKTFFQEINAFLLLKFASSQEKISLTDGPSREFLWLGIGGWKILMPIHDSGTFSQRLRDHLFLDTNLIFENGTVKTVQDLEKEIRASLPKSREEAERVLGRSETRPEERLVPLTEKLLNLISEWEKSEMIREAAGSFWKTIQSLKRTLLEFRTRLFGDPAYYDPAKSGKFAPLEGGLLEAHQSLLRFKKETDSGFFRLNFWKLYGYLIESLQALLDYRRTRVSGWARDLSKAKNVEHQELIVQEMTQELKRAELLFEVLKDTLEKDGIRGPFRDSLQRSLARLETVKSRLANRAQGRSEMRRSIERAVALATLPGEGDSVRRAALDWFGTEVPRESAQYLIEMTLREETEELEREVSERIRHFFAEYEASLLRRESENVTRFGEEMIGAFEAILKEAGGLNERAVYLGFEAPREESWRGMEAALGKALKRFRPLIKNVIVTSRRENGRLPSSLTKLLGTLNLRSPVVDRQLKVKSLLEVEQQKKLGLFSPGESGLDSGRLPGEVVPVRLEGRYEDLSPFEQEAVFLAGVLLALAQGLGIESEGLKKFVDLFDPETFKFGKNSVTIRLAAFVESLNAERASQERLSSAA